MNFKNLISVHFKMHLDENTDTVTYWLKVLNCDLISDKSAVVQEMI